MKEFNVLILNPSLENTDCLKPIVMKLVVILLAVKLSKALLHCPGNKANSNTKDLQYGVK